MPVLCMIHKQSTMEISFSTFPKATQTKYYFAYKYAHMHICNKTTPFGNYHFNLFKPQGNIDYVAST